MNDIKISGRNDLVKRGAAVVSTSHIAHEQYMRSLKTRLNDRQRIEALEEKMDLLLNMMLQLNNKN